MQEVTTTPSIKWAQRKDKLYITIDVVNVKSPVIDIIDGKSLKFQGSDNEKKYSFQIELYDEVVKDESKYVLDSRNIFLNIKKNTKGPYWPRLIKDNVKYQWIQVDWRYFVDEDEEEEDHNKPSFGEGQDFGGDLGEMDEDDEPEEKKEDHVHGENCQHEPEKKADLDDLDKEENK